MKIALNTLVKTGYNRRGKVLNSNTQFVSRQRRSTQMINSNEILRTQLHRRKSRNSNEEVGRSPKSLSQHSSTSRKSQVCAEDDADKNKLGNSNLRNVTSPRSKLSNRQSDITLSFKCHNSTRNLVNISIDLTDNDDEEAKMIVLSSLDEKNCDRETSRVSNKESENKKAKTLEKSPVSNENNCVLEQCMPRIAAIPPRCRPLRKEKNCIPGEVSSTTSQDFVVQNKNVKQIKDTSLNITSLPTEQAPTQFGLNEPTNILQIHSACGTLQNVREVGVVKPLPNQVNPCPPVTQTDILLCPYYDEISSESDYEEECDNYDEKTIKPQEFLHKTWKVVEEATSSTAEFPKVSPNNVIFSTCRNRSQFQSQTCGTISQKESKTNLDEFNEIFEMTLQTENATNFVTHDKPTCSKYVQINDPGKFNRSEPSTLVSAKELKQKTVPNQKILNGIEENNYTFDKSNMVPNTTEYSLNRVTSESAKAIQDAVNLNKIDIVEHTTENSTNIATKDINKPFSEVDNLDKLDVVRTGSSLNTLSEDNMDTAPDEDQLDKQKIVQSKTYKISNDAQSSNMKLGSDIRNLDQLEFVENTTEKASEGILKPASEEEASERYHEIQHTIVISTQLESDVSDTIDSDEDNLEQIEGHIKDRYEHVDIDKNPKTSSNKMLSENNENELFKNGDKHPPSEEICEVNTLRNTEIHKIEKVQQKKCASDNFTLDQSIQQEPQDVCKLSIFLCDTIRMDEKVDKAYQNRKTKAIETSEMTFEHIQEHLIEEEKVEKDFVENTENISPNVNKIAESQITKTESTESKTPYSVELKRSSKKVIADITVEKKQKIETSSPSTNSFTLFEERTKNNVPKTGSNADDLKSKSLETAESQVENDGDGKIAKTTSLEPGTEIQDKSVDKPGIIKKTIKFTENAAKEITKMGIESTRTACSSLNLPQLRLSATTSESAAKAKIKDAEKSTTQKSLVKHISKVSIDVGTENNVERKSKTADNSEIKIIKKPIIVESKMHINSDDEIQKKLDHSIEMVFGNKNESNVEKEPSIESKLDSYIEKTTESTQKTPAATKGQLDEITTELLDRGIDAILGSANKVFHKDQIEEVNEDPSQSQSKLKLDILTTQIINELFIEKNSEKNKKIEFECNLEKRLNDSTKAIFNKIKQNPEQLAATNAVSKKSFADVKVVVPNVPHQSPHADYFPSIMHDDDEEAVKLKGNAVALPTNLVEANTSNLEILTLSSIPDIPTDFTSFLDFFNQLQSQAEPQETGCMLSGNNYVQKWSESSFAHETFKNKSPNAVPIPVPSERHNIFISQIFESNPDTILFDEADVGFDFDGNVTVENLLVHDDDDLFRFSELDKTHSHNESENSTNSGNEGADDISHAIKPIACDQSYNKEAKANYENKTEMEKTEYAEGLKKVSLELDKISDPLNINEIDKDLETGISTPSKPTNTAKSSVPFERKNSQESEIRIAAQRESSQDTENRENENCILKTSPKLTLSEDFLFTHSKLSVNATVFWKKPRNRKNTIASNSFVAPTESSTVESTISTTSPPTTPSITQPSTPQSELPVIVENYLMKKSFMKRGLSHVLEADVKSNTQKVSSKLIPKAILSDSKSEQSNKIDPIKLKFTEESSKLTSNKKRKVERIKGISSSQENTAITIVKPDDTFTSLSIAAMSSEAPHTVSTSTSVQSIEDKLIFQGQKSNVDEASKFIEISIRDTGNNSFRSVLNTFRISFGKGI